MKHTKITQQFTKRTELLKQELIIKLEKLEAKRNQRSETGTRTPSIRTALKDTFTYAKLRLEQRTKDTERIKRFYELIDSQYEDICYLQCAKEAVITSTVENNLNDIFPLIKTYPDLILDLATIFPDPPLDIKNAIDSKLLWQPPSINTTTAYKFDPITHQIMDAKYRYLMNMDGNLIRKYLDDKKSVEFNIGINSELFLQLSNQSRWNTLWVQIGNTLMYMDTISEAKALQNMNIKSNPKRRLGTDLVTLQTITYILKKFVLLPFTIRPDGKYDLSHHTQQWGTCLIPLLYSLLELSKEEKGCNVNVDFLVPIITYRVKCAYTSFESETLNRKGIYSSMIKELTFAINKYARYNLSQSGKVQTIRNYDGNVEVRTIPTEQTDLRAEIETLCDKDFLKVFDRYKNMLNNGTHTENTELMRWLSGVVLTMGNTGLYYKTSLVLEKEKAVASQTLGTLNFPKPDKMLVLNDIKMDLRTDWNSGDEIFKEMSIRYKKLIHKHLHHLDVNMQEWFYLLLTNRSQGFKVDVEKFVHTMGIDPSLLTDLRNVGQVRVASFLLDNETYAIYSKFFEELQRDGLCTIRFSNNRKSRIIEILPNVDQTGYAIVLKMFEEFKVECDDIAVGKQIGGILDMTMQCTITGAEHGISIFSDVAGMDAHTQPNIAVMFLKMLAEEIIDNDVGPHNYFPFKTSDCIVHSVFDHTNSRLFGNKVTGVSEVYTLQKIPALAQALLLIASQRLNKKYILKDTIFNCNIDINPSIFESGRFDTSAQHSTALKICADIVYDNIKNEVPMAAGKFQAFPLKFGDDSYEGILNMGMNREEQETLLAHILKKTSDVLYRIGLRADSEMSSYYGDFLQQTAMCGVVLPKSARSTIYTDEKNALVNRDVIDQITNLANIITASAQRTYAPDNVCSIIRNIWATNRSYRILSSKNLVITPRLAPYIRTYSGKSYLQYPYIMISMPPLNFPNQTFVFDNGLVLPASSSVRTVGYAKLNYVWNETIPINIREALLTANAPFVGEVTANDPLHAFEVSLAGTHIVESILFFSYNRSQELSKTRFERLSDPIAKMGDIAKNYFNETKLYISSRSAMTLHKTYNITLPDSLLYYMKPIEQLKDMFHTRGETDDEAIGLNDAYLAHLNKIFKQMPKTVSDSIIATCVFWKPSKEVIETYSNESYQLPLMPSYNIDSDHYRAQVLVGNAFRNAQRANKSLVSFTSRYGGSYNMEAIHKIGLQAKAASSRTGNAFQLFLDAMQLPTTIRNAVESMFENENTILLPDLYHSGFQPEQNFSISDSIINVSNNYILFNTVQSKSGQDTLTVVLRDYLFLTCNNDPPKYRLMPIMPPVTLVRYNLRGLLSRIGIKAL